MRLAPLKPGTWVTSATNRNAVGMVVSDEKDGKCEVFWHGSGGVCLTDRMMLKLACLHDPAQSPHHCLVCCE